MEEIKQKQSLADIARKKRYLHLIEKLHSGTPLTNVEIKELEEFEKEPQEQLVDGNGKSCWEEKIKEYEAALLEIKLKKAQGELISIEEVERGRISRIIAVKRAFLELPAQLAPTLHLYEPKDVEVILYNAISEIIDEFAGDTNENVET